jgi:single-stranded DNA-binding protein
MIDALVSGAMHGTAQACVATSGRPYFRCTVRVPVADGAALFVRVTAFSSTVGETLLALADGDSVALTGSLKPGAWVDRDGTARPNLDVVATQVLTVYSMRKRRAAVAAAGQAAAPSGPGDGPDEGPDPWLDEGGR